MPLARHLWLRDLEERGEEVGDKLRGAIKLLMISVNCALYKETVNTLLVQLSNIKILNFSPKVYLYAVLYLLTCIY